VENRANYTTFVNDVDFHIVPLLNVDGYRYSHSKNRMWRKNRKIIPGSCNGVDLNRNFGYKWGQIGGATVDTCAWNYAGKDAFSEPESKAIQNYVLQNEIGYFQVNLN
jgi:carboxypeptidase A4